MISEPSDEASMSFDSSADAEFERRRARRASLGMFRTIIPMTTACFIIAMFAEVFLGDIFVLTTSSMEPVAAGRHGGADSVLLSRFHAANGKAARWSVLLFNYPNNRRVNYLKRLVGLGGEQLLIRGGDLYLINPSFNGSIGDAYAKGFLSILRKPSHLQEQLLEELPIVNAHEWENLDDNLWRRHFASSEGAPTAWQVREGSAILNSEGRAQVRILRPLKDSLFDTLKPADMGGIPRKVAGGENDISDLSLVVRVRPTKIGGSIILSIEDGPAQMKFEAWIGIGESPDGAPNDQTRLLAGEIAVGSSPLRLPVNEWAEIRFESIDDRLRLLVNGEPALVRDIHHAPVPAKGSGQSPASSVAFGGENLDCQFQPVSLSRDLHYTENGQSRFNIPENHYVLRGDNTASSADSRAWKRVAIERSSDGAVLYGDAQGSPAGNSSLQFQNPFENPDGSWTFCDALGRYHPFEVTRDWRALASWRTPYIAEDEVLGRAIAVIWPLDRCTWLR